MLGKCCTTELQPSPCPLIFLLSKGDLLGKQNYTLRGELAVPVKMASQEAVGLGFYPVGWGYSVVRN
jgi:hypothetical protein